MGRPENRRKVAVELPKGSIRFYVRFSNHNGEYPAGWDVPRFLFATVNLETINESAPSRFVADVRRAELCEM